MQNILHRSFHSHVAAKVAQFLKSLQCSPQVSSFHRSQSPFHGPSHSLEVQIALKVMVRLGFCNITSFFAIFITQECKAKQDKFSPKSN